MERTPNELERRHWEEWEILLRLHDLPELLEAAAQRDIGEFQLQQRLRREYPDELVRAALALRDCRQRAAEKYQNADRLWLDRTGFEQGTHEAVAAHKAARFRGEVWDLCTGIGADAGALAKHCRVITVDHNPVNCQRAQWNMDAGKSLL
ncbi:MAG: hypothetical protein U0903_17205 [Planctomycetales bacterium]